MSIAARALVALVLLLIAAGGAYWAGDRQRNNAWLAKEAGIVRDAHQKYQEEVGRGQQAAGNYLDDLRDQETRYADLESKFETLRKRVPLLVPPAAGQPLAAAARPEPGVDSPGSPSPQCIQLVVRPQLSLGAVWMWNSALEGRDVPAGACGADAATPQACAAAAGLTAADAWDNHAVNARTCASDRLRYERLIDYLEGRKP